MDLIADALDVDDDVVLAIGIDHTLQLADHRMPSGLIMSMVGK
jgi:hypothetical protein